MQIVTTLQELRQQRSRLPAPVGLVPTMGYLHAGHLSLVEQARHDCRSVVVSIFVNPTQFSPNEDLARYPRDLQRDLGLLEAAGVDLVWTPTLEVMYPPGYQTWVTVDEVTQVLEGAVRPGHFRGVATVVAKLFNAVQPDRAYFGQKDAQQAAVIRRMALDLNFALDVVVCPIVREPDGLAMSSRNVYLGVQERQAAAGIYRALTRAQVEFAAGERQADQLRQAVLDGLAQEPLLQPQYVSCADPNTFQELEKVEQQALISLAVFCGGSEGKKTRLIDNILVSSHDLSGGSHVVDH